MGEFCYWCNLELPNRQELEKHVEQNHSHLKPKIKV